jgi:hypothetical protein
LSRPYGRGRPSNCEAIQWVDRHGSGLTISKQCLYVRDLVKWGETPNFGSTSLLIRMTGSGTQSTWSESWTSSEFITTKIGFTSRSVAALQGKIWRTAARPCGPLSLMAAPLPRSVPDANRSVIYEFAMDRVRNSNCAGAPSMIRLACRSFGRALVGVRRAGTCRQLGRGRKKCYSVLKIRRHLLSDIRRAPAWRARSKLPSERPEGQPCRSSGRPASPWQWPAAHQQLRPRMHRRKTPPRLP